MNVPNSDGDFAIDVVGDAKVEGVLKREMERIGLTDDKMEQLRGAQAATMLADVKRLAASKGNINAQVRVCGRRLG